MFKPRKRNPSEPPPLVLMNPELRVRQLRYAANIGAVPTVPLSRYYEVLLDLSNMGLEYLKSKKLERAFIVFKRIEYFIYHRLKDHNGYKTFTSPAKAKIMSRIPMIMFVAQQIIVEFVMPVYERQAAYFRFEELQRRLRVIDPQIWNSIMPEAMRREEQFYLEAEEISTRFGVELLSFLPKEIIPDDNHPSNYPPRTFPARSLNNQKKQAPGERLAEETPFTAAVNSIKKCEMKLPINDNQPIATLIRNMNEIMNKALSNVFPNMSFSVPTISQLQINPSTAVDPGVRLIVPDAANCRDTCSPRVQHMYLMPEKVAAPRAIPPEEVVLSSTNTDPLDYNPKISLDSYIDLLVETFKFNSATTTGYNVFQVNANHLTSPSTAGFMLHLEPIEMVEQATSTSSSSTEEGSLPAPPIRKEPMQLLNTFGQVVKIVPRSKKAEVPVPDAGASSSAIVPEPDPGTPRVAPPTEPLAKNPQTADSDTKYGVWSKRGPALRPDGLLTLQLLSGIELSREVLDSLKPMPEGGIQSVGQQLPIIRKRTSDVEPSLEEIQREKRPSMEEAGNVPAPLSETDPASSINIGKDEALFKEPQ